MLTRSIGPLGLYFSLLVSSAITLVFLYKMLIMDAASIHMSFNGLWNLGVMLLGLMVSFMGINYLIITTFFVFKWMIGVIRMLFLRTGTEPSFSSVLFHFLTGFGLAYGYYVGAFMVYAALDHNPQMSFYSPREGYDWVALLDIFFSWSYVLSAVITILAFVLSHLARFILRSKIFLH